MNNLNGSTIHPFALDGGYGYTKAYGVLGLTRFPSVVGTYDPGNMSLYETSRLSIAIDGKRYMLGDTALLESKFVTHREDRSYITSMEWDILWKTAFSEVFHPGSYRIFAVSGLPVNYYTDAEIMRKRLVGHHAFYANDAQYQVEIVHAKIVEQPYGGIMDFLLDGEGRVVSTHAPGHLALIDIGSMTVNLIGVQRMLEISGESDTLENGIWKAAHALRDRLRVEYPDHNWTEYESMKAIETKSITYHGRKDITPLVQQALSNLTMAIRSRISALWGKGANLDAMIFSGGGARIIGEALKEDFPHAIILDTPETSNVKGYFKLAHRLLPKVLEQYS